MDTPGVELIGYFRYDSGAPYRLWKLTADAPELPLNDGWEDDVDGPPHAAAGDELKEDKEDRGSHFKLYRDDYVVARPEWWQVAHLFGGTLPSWKRKKAQVAEPEAALLQEHECEFTSGKPSPVWKFLRDFDAGGGWMIPTGAALFEASAPLRTRRAMYGEWTVCPDLNDSKSAYGIWRSEAEQFLRLDALERTPEHVAVLRAVGAPLPTGGRWSTSLALLNEDVPGLARRGDVLAYAKPDDRAVLRGIVRDLCKPELEVLRTAVKDEPRVLTDISPGMSDCWRWSGGEVRRFVSDRRRWGKGRSQLQLIRPVRPEPVTAPLAALSDAHALFELIAASGGRMPSGQA